MNYMIMECHPGYAVALDEAGNFLKVANRQYEPGQYVAQVIPMQEPVRKNSRRWLYPLAAVAACFVLLLGLFLPATPRVYGSVYMKINPEVRIDVDRRDRVIGLAGVNPDGIDLIEGYDFYKKGLDLVTNELISRAMEMGYLQDAGQITLRLDSEDQVWVDTCSHHLQKRLRDNRAVDVQIESHGAHHESTSQVPAKETVGGHHGKAESTGNHHGPENGEGNRYGAEESTGSHHDEPEGHSGSGQHHNSDH